jgi:hypothetical protein
MNNLTNLTNDVFFTSINLNNLNNLRQHVYHMTFIRFLNQIKTVPKCVDCKHYSLQDIKYHLIQGTTHMYAEAKCLKTIVRCSNTGLYKSEYAYIARGENVMCGPKGLKFEPIKKA